MLLLVAVCYRCRRCCRCVRRYVILLKRWLLSGQQCWRLLLGRVVLLQERWVGGMLRSVLVVGVDVVLPDLFLAVVEETVVERT